MSKKARLRKKVCRKLSKAWRDAKLDEQLEKDFETFLIFGEVWSPRPPSIEELTSQDVSLVRNVQLEPLTLIRENSTPTKKLHNNVLDLFFKKK